MSTDIRKTHEKQKIMKNSIYYLMIISGAFLMSCARGNEYCECLDENLKHLKAHRLKGYEGEMQESSVKCKELMKIEMERLDSGSLSKRKERVIEGFTEEECPRALINGKTYLLFNSNDYLVRLSVCDGAGE